MYFYSVAYRFNFIILYFYNLQYNYHNILINYIFFDIKNSNISFVFDENNYNIHIYLQQKEFI